MRATLLWRGRRASRSDTVPRAPDIQDRAVGEGGEAFEPRPEGLALDEGPVGAVRPRRGVVERPAAEQDPVDRMKAAVDREQLRRVGGQAQGRPVGMERGLEREIGRQELCGVHVHAELVVGTGVRRAQMAVGQGDVVADPEGAEREAGDQRQAPQQRAQVPPAA